MYGRLCETKSRDDETLDVEYTQNQNIVIPVFETLPVNYETHDCETVTKAMWGPVRLVKPQQERGIVESQFERFLV